MYGAGQMPPRSYTILTPPPPPYPTLPCATQGVFGNAYAAEYLGMPVSATILAYTSASPVSTSTSAAVNTSTAPSAVTASAVLRATATAELRTLAGLVRPHPRLARTHGNEMVSPHVPLREVNSGGGGGGEMDTTGDGESVDANFAAVTTALVLVGELVDGGTLRDRVVAAGYAAPCVGDEGEDGGYGDGDKPPSGLETPGDFDGGGGKEEDGGVVWRWRGAGVLQRRRVLADIAEGLAYLHERGVCHGALSSDNVLVDAEGRAKVRRCSEAAGGA